MNLELTMLENFTKQTMKTLETSYPLQLDVIRILQQL